MICLHVNESYNQKHLFGKARVGQPGIGQLLNHKGAKAAQKLISSALNGCTEIDLETLSIFLRYFYKILIHFLRLDENFRHFWLEPAG